MSYYHFPWKLQKLYEQTGATGPDSAASAERGKAHRGRGSLPTGSGLSLPEERGLGGGQLGGVQAGPWKLRCISIGPIE